MISSGLSLRAVVAVATAVVVVTLVLLQIGDARSSTSAGEAISEQFGELRRGDGAIPGSALSLMGATGLEVTRSTQAGAALPGEHAVGVARRTDKDSASAPDDLVCFAGRLDAVFNTARDYGACQHWDIVEQQGLYYQSSSKDGFQAIIFAPTAGSTPQDVSVTFEPSVEDYRQAEVFDDHGLVLVRGPVPASDVELVGRVIVQRPGGPAMEFELANPAVAVGVE